MKRTPPRKGERQVRAAEIDSTEGRTIRFVASDETVDRYGDIIRASGSDLRNYAKNGPLLFAHDSRLIIGTAKAWVEGKQLLADATFLEEGVSDFADEIWRITDAGALKATSVGFLPTEIPNPIWADAKEQVLTGFEFIAQELLELSVVSVPANPAALALARSLASETTIRRVFTDDLGASARVAADIGVDRSPSRGFTPCPEDKGDLMSLRKQIDGLRTKRNTHLDAMTALSELAANDNRLFTAEEQAAFDKDNGEIKDIDAQIERLETADRLAATRAVPALSPLDPSPGAEVIPFKPFKAQAFTRYVLALAISKGKGNLPQSLEIARRWDHQTPEVSAVLRAAVAAGTTTDPVWAAPLVNYQLMTNEFIELLRPETIFGKLNGYRNIPFNVKIPRQTAGATAGWVGEGLSKPVSKLAFDGITVPWAKIAVICVITQELARFSNPSAEQLVRDDLIAAISLFIDQQLLDPTVTASAGLRPASITNGVVAIPSTGGTVAAVTTDLSQAMLQMAAALGSIGRPIWIMSGTAAMYLATLRTAQDIFAFPGMGAASNSGGAQGTSGLTLLGVPVIISGNVVVTAGKSSIVLLDQSQLMVADDGQVMVDTSTEAALQLDSAPATPPTPLVSLWQQNMLGIKAERFIYWQMRRAGAVQIITGFPAAGA